MVRQLTFAILFAVVALVLPARDSSAQGLIQLGTPVTFPPPPTITHYGFKRFTLELDPGRIEVVLVSNDANKHILNFEYPRDCGAFGVDSEGNPNPPVCPARDTSAEITALIGSLDTANLSLANLNLRRRIMGFLCTDFPSRLGGVCTVQ